MKLFLILGTLVTIAALFVAVEETKTEDFLFEEFSASVSMLRHLLLFQS